MCIPKVSNSFSSKPFQVFSLGKDGNHFQVHQKPRVNVALLYAICMHFQHRTAYSLSEYIILLGVWNQSRFDNGDERKTLKSRGNERVHAILLKSVKNY